ncbi:hypothetical protein MPSEU_000606800 [Mayamaea pseudoterrestris]|nr:hypothetical protein MPSEU_000606800 [Mayamaea pseudoterrestris]
MQSPSLGPIQPSRRPSLNDMTMNMNMGGMGKRNPTKAPTLVIPSLAPIAQPTRRPTRRPITNMMNLNMRMNGMMSMGMGMKMVGMLKGIKGSKSVAVKGPKGGMMNNDNSMKGIKGGMGGNWKDAKKAMNGGSQSLKGGVNSQLNRFVGGVKGPMKVTKVVKRAEMKGKATKGSKATAATLVKRDGKGMKRIVYTKRRSRVGMAPHSMSSNRGMNTRKANKDILFFVTAFLPRVSLASKETVPTSDTAAFPPRLASPVFDNGIGKPDKVPIRSVNPATIAETSARPERRSSMALTTVSESTIDGYRSILFALALVLCFLGVLLMYTSWRYKNKLRGKHQLSKQAPGERGQPLISAAIENIYMTER